jgi:hypothetical protein
MTEIHCLAEMMNFNLPFLKVGLARQRVRYIESIYDGITITCILFFGINQLATLFTIFFYENFILKDIWITLLNLSGTYISLLYLRDEKPLHNLLYCTCFRGYQLVYALRQCKRKYIVHFTVYTIFTLITAIYGGWHLFFHTKNLDLPLIPKIITDVFVTLFDSYIFVYSFSHYIGFSLTYLNLELLIQGFIDHLSETIANITIRSIREEVLCIWPSEESNYVFDIHYCILCIEISSGK